MPFGFSSRSKAVSRPASWRAGSCGRSSGSHGSRGRGHIAGRLEVYTSAVIAGLHLPVQDTRLPGRQRRSGQPHRGRLSSRILHLAGAPSRRAAWRSHTVPGTHQTIVERQEANAPPGAECQPTSGRVGSGSAARALAESRGSFRHQGRIARRGLARLCVVVGRQRAEGQRLARRGDPGVGFSQDDQVCPEQCPCGHLAGAVGANAEAAVLD